MSSKQYTAQAREVLAYARTVARKIGDGYVGTEHILLGLLHVGGCVAAQVLVSNGMEESKIEELTSQLVSLDNDMKLATKREDAYSPRALKVLDMAEDLASQYGNGIIGTEHLLMAIAKEGDNVAARLIVTIGISTQKIYADTLSAIGEDPNNYREDMGLQSRRGGQSYLDAFGRDLTALAHDNRLDPVVGRDTEIERVIQILSRRTKNNPCLVGEPGVGKTAIVEGLAERIVSGDVPVTVRNKRVVTLDIAGMVAGSKYRGEFEERIKRVIKEVMDSKDVILFVDELHTLIGAGGAEGSIDASNILKPELARGELQMIGATTVAEYHKYIERDKALERRFQPVDVTEPTVEETIQILNGVKGQYEEHHHVTISDSAITAAAELSERYISDRFLPDKAIDLIDEASAAVRLGPGKRTGQLKSLQAEIDGTDEELARAIKFEDFEEALAIKKRQDVLLSKQLKLIRKDEEEESAKRYVVSEDDIARVVARWTKIPVERIAVKETERLLKLESELHARVVGQEEAVTAIAKSIRRNRAGLGDPNRPIGSFLFLGPTGVGKTELSKALAESLFGDENALIRVDMSEYMESHSVARIIGSPPGYVGFEEGGQLSEKVRQHPYSVILFDEIEKAHPDVFNILLQVLDDGHITDGKGREVNFKNTVIIMTSNAGAGRIIEPKNLGFVTDTSESRSYDQMKDAVMEEVRHIFKPEFINRIDEIIVFHQLTNKQMLDIVTLLAGNISKRCEQGMNIRLKVTHALKEHIVDTYADKKMGARPLKRAMQSVIEDELAERVLKGEISSGDIVTAGYKGGETVFNVTGKMTD